MPDFMTVDITDDAIAAPIIANLRLPNGKAILAAFKTEALLLDYRFSKQWNRAPIPDGALHVLGRAVAAVESGAIGHLLAKQIIDAIEYQRVYMHAGPSTPTLLAEEQRRFATIADDIHTIDSLAATDEPAPSSGTDFRALEPVTLTVDVVGDQVIVSGEQQFATFNWKATLWGNEAKRLSIQPERRSLGDTLPATYRVVAGAGDETSGSTGVVAKHLSESEAKDLIRRIQDGVKESLGIGNVSDNVVQVEEPTTSVAAVEPTRRSMVTAVLEFVANAASAVAHIVFFLGLALAGTYAFLFGLLKLFIWVIR
ncbi:hypothetical protein [Burkholderia sp. 572]|uniref:hypothetical protein n=1 Tax=Burkholderia sp. 572 TaxID=3156414 RepID=UPI0033953DD5